MDNQPHKQAPKCRNDHNGKGWKGMGKVQDILCATVKHVLSHFYDKPEKDSPIPTQQTYNRSYNEGVKTFINTIASELLWEAVM